MKSLIIICDVITCSSSFLIIVTAAFISVMMLGYLALTGIVWIGCENSTSTNFGMDEYIPKEIEIDGVRLNLPRIHEITE